MKFTTVATVLLASSAAASPLTRRAVAGCNADFNLNDAQLVVGLGADPAGERAQEVRAVVTNKGKFTGQGSALNFQLVARFICDRINEQCKGNAALVNSCRGAVAQVGKGGKNIDAATAQTLGAGVDSFNEALGIDTDFINTLAQQVGGGNNANNGNDDDDDDDDDDDNNNNQGNNNGNANKNNGANKANKGGAAANLAGCNANFNVNDCQLVVGLGADPAGERAQEVRAVVTGRGVCTGQGSALNFQLVARFICDRINEQCKGNTALVNSCRGAVNQVGKGGKNINAAAARTLGQGVDAFNRAIGVNTNFANTLAGQVGGGGGGANAGNKGNNGNNGNKGNNGNQGNNGGNKNKGNNKGNNGGVNAAGCNAGFNVNDCQLVVGLGADPAGERAQEVRAVVTGRGVCKGQGSALNFQLVANFICDRINEQCKGNTNLVNSCRGAVKQVGKGGKNINAAAARTLGAGVDSFNKAIGVNTNFANTLAGQVGGGANFVSVKAVDTTGCNAGLNIEDAKLVVGLGADPNGERAQEVRAVVTGNGVFTGQGSALNFQLVANFICDRLNEQCKGNTNLVNSCRGAVKQVGKGGKNIDAATAQTLGAGADSFNQAIGITSDFATTLVNEVSGGNGGGNGNNNGNNGNNNGNGNDNGNNGNGNGNAGTAGCDAGLNINDATLIVGLGADPAGERAQEVRAVVTNKGKFTGQGSALNFQLVANFICDRLNEQCKGNTNLVNSCRGAVKQVGKGGKNIDAATAQTLGAGADSFNQAIGITTNFATTLVNEVTGGNGGGNAGNGNNNGNNGNGNDNAGNNGNAGNGNAGNGATLDAAAVQNLITILEQAIALIA